MFDVCRELGQCDTLDDDDDGVPSRPRFDCDVMHHKREWEASSSPSVSALKLQKPLAPFLQMQEVSRFLCDDDIMKAFGLTGGICQHNVCRQAKDGTVSCRVD